jgi:hypothetical protein
MRIISVHKEQKEIQKTMAQQQKQTSQKLEKLQREASTQYPEVEDQCQEDTSEPGPDLELLLRLEAAFPDLTREVLELCVSVHNLFTQEHGTEEYPAEAALNNLVEQYSKQNVTQTEPDPEEQGFTFAGS